MSPDNIFSISFDSLCLGKKSLKSEKGNVSISNTTNTRACLHFLILLEKVSEQWWYYEGSIEIVGSLIL
jgi:hypothetical protein